MRQYFDRIALRTPFPARIFIGSDQLLFLRVHRDHRAPGAELPDRLIGQRTSVCRTELHICFAQKLPPRRAGGPKPRFQPAKRPCRTGCRVGTGPLDRWGHLPFENLTGDPSQEYIADGMTEEMITQMGELNPGHIGVIARTSAMQFKGTKKAQRRSRRNERPSCGPE
jgi:hypothetical protein